MSCLVALRQMEGATARLVARPGNPQHSLCATSILCSKPGRLCLQEGRGCTLVPHPPSWMGALLEAGGESFWGLERVRGASAGCMPAF